MVFITASTSDDWETQVKTMVTARLAKLAFSMAALAWGVTLVAPRAAAAEPQRIEIQAKRFTFEPASITLKKGEPVVLILKSDDVPHGLRFRDLGVNVKAPKKGSGQVAFTPGKAGDFVGHCSVFCGAGHGKMTFTLHVVN